MYSVWMPPVSRVLITLLLTGGLIACGQKPEESTETAAATPPVVTPAAEMPVSETPAPESPVDWDKRLSRQLHEADATQRLDAVRQLSDMADTGALSDGPLQLLINAYEMDQSPEVRDAVARVLGKSCHPAALDILLRSLKKEIGQVRPETLIILGETGDFAVAEALDQFAAKGSDTPTPEEQGLIAMAEQSRQQIMQRGGRRAPCRTLAK